MAELEQEFEVYLKRSDLKFSCAHFIAHPGFREKLHGHNYNLSVRLTGSRIRGGYLIDFGAVKKVCRKLCKDLHERFICPLLSDALQFEIGQQQVVITCEDGSMFSFPQGDCVLLPIAHSSAEELAQYLFCEIVREISVTTLMERGIRVIDVGIIEVQDQEAHYKVTLPPSWTDADFEAMVVAMQQSSKGKVPEHCSSVTY